MRDYAVLLDSPGTPTSRIQIARLGTVNDSRYGEFEITTENVENWQRNLSHLPGQRALIDFEHRSEKNPRDSSAAGWITGIDLDGEKVMADAEWSDKGEAAIRNKRYLFLSPAFGKYRNEHGEIFDDTLCSTALTNRPVLGSLPMLTLASEERVSEARASEISILQQLVELDIPAKERKQAASEGNALPDGSYPIRNAAELHSAAVLAASGHGDVAGARKLIRKRAADLGVSLSHLPGFRQSAANGSDSRRTMDKELLTLLDLDETADEAKVLEAVTELKTKAQTPAETPAAPEVKTLEQQAAEQGMMILDAERVTKLVSDAAAGRKAATELHEERRDRVWTRALEAMVRVPAQQEAFLKHYELDADTVVAAIDDDIKSGRKLLNAKPVGANGEDDDAPVTMATLIEKKLTELGDGANYNDAYLKVLDDIEKGRVQL